MIFLKFQCHPVTPLRIKILRVETILSAQQARPSVLALPTWPLQPHTLVPVTVPGCFDFSCPVPWHMLFSCPDHPCSWPGPRLSSGVTSFRLSWASPGPFLLVSPSLYPSHLGPHQPAQSKTAGMISYSPCKPSTWHRCSINVSLKGTQTELGDA